MRPSSIFTAWIPRESVDPNKFVPRAKRISFTWPLIAMNFLRALMKDEYLISSMTSIWTDREVKPENTIAHRLAWATFMTPFVRRAQFPKVQMYRLRRWPWWMKDLTKSIIIWCSGFLLVFLQVTMINCVCYQPVWSYYPKASRSNGSISKMSN